MVPGNPHQNGVAEHMNWTILECARIMRIHAGLPKQFGIDAVNTMVYLINRGPSMPLNYGIPEEASTSKEINLNYLHTFSCISYVRAYVRVGLDRRSKLVPKSNRCIFIGYRTSEYGYRFWNLEN